MHKSVNNFFFFEILLHKFNFVSRNLKKNNLIDLKLGISKGILHRTKIYKYQIKNSITFSKNNGSIYFKMLS